MTGILRPLESRPALELRKKRLICSNLCYILFVYAGEVPERPKGADCKSVGNAFGGSNPPLSITGRDWLNRQAIISIIDLFFLGGNSSIGRASAFQAEGCGFEPRFPLQR
jgi:hypothetical protein